jgi:hypothetical protein
MAIATAVKRGAFIYVYDEKNRQILTLSAGNKPEDGLTGVYVHHRQCTTGWLHLYVQREGRADQYPCGRIGDRGRRRGQTTHPPRRGRARNRECDTDHHALGAVCHPDGVPDVS